MKRFKNFISETSWIFEKKLAKICWTFWLILDHFEALFQHETAITFQEAHLVTSATGMAKFQWKIWNVRYLNGRPGRFVKMNKKEAMRRQRKKGREKEGEQTKKREKEQDVAKFRTTRVWYHLSARIPEETEPCQRQEFTDAHRTVAVNLLGAYPHVISLITENLDNAWPTRSPFWYPISEYNVIQLDTILDLGSM